MYKGFVCLKVEGCMIWDEPTGITELTQPLDGFLSYQVCAHTGKIAMSLLGLWSQAMKKTQAS